MNVLCSLSLFSLFIQASTITGDNQYVESLVVVPSASNFDNVAYNIDIIYDDAVTKSVENAFNLAVTRWTSIITKDLGNAIRMTSGTEICGRYIKKDLDCDDLIIFAKVGPIDGPSQLTAHTEICSLDSKNFPRFVEITIDEADVKSLTDKNQLNSAVLHEIGHALGITGSVLDKPSRDLINTSTTKPFVTYNGLRGNQGNADVGGVGKVVFEEGEEPGHLKKDIYGDELMTNLVTGNTQPISLVTIGILADLGYVVNRNRADPFKTTKKLNAVAGFALQESDVWETIDSGRMISGLVEESDDASVNSAVIGGAAAGGLTVIGAAALVAFRRRRSNSRNSLNSQSEKVMVSGNPEFNVA